MLALNGKLLLLHLRSRNSLKNLLNSSSAITISFFSTKSTTSYDDQYIREYNRKLEKNEISFDQNQLNVVYKLNEFHKRLYNMPHALQEEKERGKTLRESIRKSLMSFLSSSGKQSSAPENEKASESLVKGIYLYGGVGCGKTMLMDLAYDMLPADRKKLRIHFNKFMLNIHQSIHLIKNRSSLTSHSSVDIVADQLIDDYNMLFFDEFQVTDIADAMLMSGLFTALFERGMACFFTSNRAPSDLYKNGLQRELFLPFIDILHSYCDVICLDSIDYRKLTGESLNRVYFNSDNENFLLNHLILNLVNLIDLHTPISDDRSELPSSELKKTMEEQLNEKFKRVRIEILGREVILERCYKSILDTNFSFLCEESRSSVDYIELCKMFDVIIVRNTPIISLNDASSFKRFISFIDTVYDNRVKLVLSAKSVIPFILMDRKTKSNAYDEEIFAVDRTISRLIEIQSESYAKQNRFSLNYENTRFL